MSSFTKAIGFAPQRVKRYGLWRLLPPGMQKQKYKVTEGFAWRVDSHRVMHVKQGFEFDGASVPFFFIWIFPRAHSDYIQAACLHDWLYCTQTTSRRFADRQFYLAMRVLNVPVLYAWLMYAAVRLGGFGAWKKKHNK